jgi:hypothetical protein
VNIPNNTKPGEPTILLPFPSKRQLSILIEFDQVKEQKLLMNWQLLAVREPYKICAACPTPLFSNKQPLYVMSALSWML